MITAFLGILNEIVLNNEDIPEYNKFPLEASKVAKPNEVEVDTIILFWFVLYDNEFKLVMLSAALLEYKYLNHIKLGVGPVSLKLPIIGTLWTTPNKSLKYPCPPSINVDKSSNISK